MTPLTSFAASECPCPVGASPSPATISRVQKPKFRKASISITPSTVQKGLDADPAVLAQHVNQRADTTTSVSSSNGPPKPSSASSTPRVSGIDSDIDGLNGTTALPNASKEDDSRQPRLQLGMMGVGGFGTASDEVGWSGDWPDVNICNQSKPAPTQKQPATTNNCCQPQPQPVSNCCQPKLQVQQPSRTSASCCSQTQQPAMNGPSGFIELNGGVADPFNANITFGGFPFGLQATPVNHGDTSDHNCLCGDGCQCLGCAMHPRNTTTMDYVSYHVGMMMRDHPNHRIPMNLPHPSHQMLAPGFHPYQYPPPYFSGYYPPQYLPQPNVGPMHVFDPGFAMAFNNGWQYPEGAASMAQTPSLGVEQFQQPVTVAPPPLSFDTFTSNYGSQRSESAALPKTSSHTRNRTADGSVEPSSESKKDAADGDGNAKTPFDPESPADDDSTSTLSPTSYFVQPFALPGCSEGSCQCGEGCKCPGCRTHSGHEPAEQSDGREASVGLPSHAATTRPVSTEDTFSGGLTAPFSPFLTTVPV
jgi:hypothetical protein